LLRILTLLLPVLIRLLLLLVVLPLLVLGHEVVNLFGGHAIVGMIDERILGHDKRWRLAFGFCGLIVFIEEIVDGVIGSDVEFAQVALAEPERMEQSGMEDFMRENGVELGIGAFVEEFRIVPKRFAVRAESRDGSVFDWLKMHQERAEEWLFNEQGDAGLYETFVHGVWMSEGHCSER
jgi:hypothetical protein